MRKLIEGVALSLILSSSALAGEITQLDSSIDFRAVYWHGNQVWASGTAGSVYMSADNGQHWQAITAPQNSEQLEFRDIQPLGDGKVLLMSAGEGESSRIYATQNNGVAWQQVSTGTNQQFYDCLQMIDNQEGYLYGDADDQGLFVLQTEDSGSHWQRVALPMPAQAAEGGFASSGTCVNRGNSNIKVVIGTGNAAKPRLLLRDSSGWMAIDTPFVGGPSAGIFSVQLSGDYLYAFGGSLKTLDKPASAWRYSLIDKHWSPLPAVPLKGAVYGSAVYQSADSAQLWITNPNGVASLDLAAFNSAAANVATPAAETKTAETKATSNSSVAGIQWQKRSKLNMWSISCREKLGCISVGQQGTIQRFPVKTAAATK